MITRRGRFARSKQVIQCQGTMACHAACTPVILGGVAGFGYDRSGSYLTGPGRGWLAGLELPAVSREIVTDALAVIDGLAPLTGRIDGELGRAHPTVRGSDLHVRHGHIPRAGGHQAPRARSLFGMSRRQRRARSSD